ncbi:hypothetical protein CPC16_007444 [Podila verticillata]|nr:hypothetical protein CPC16_007444 [Podila verticillata]KFH69054.1 hypothetical protein MVEG_05856 [Podila verticillata NRRL 6337]
MCIYNPKVQTVLKRAFNEGHQIASHTWSHPQLTKLTVDDITLEMTKLEQAFQDVLGVVPCYMRPPEGDGTFGHDLVGDQKVQGTLKSLGYVITTGKLPRSTRTRVEAQKAEYTRVMDAAPKGATHMALHHDTYESTVKEVAPWAIRHIKSLGYKIMPVAECLVMQIRVRGPRRLDQLPHSTCQP